MSGKPPKYFSFFTTRNKLSDETHLFGCRKEFLWQKSALPSKTGNTGIYCSLQDRLVPQLLLPVLLLIRHDVDHLLVSYLNKMVIQFFLVQGCSLFSMQNLLPEFILNSYLFKYPSTALDFQLSSNTIPLENSCKSSIPFYHLKEVTERAGLKKTTLQMTTYLETSLKDVWKQNQFNSSLEL